MKTASPFFSDFFNTDCLVIDGDPWFSITGATKTLYGSIGGASVDRLRTQLAKMSSPKTPVTAVDLRELDGFCPVQTTSGKGRAQEALAMSQEVFKSLLKLYRGKSTVAGRYAEEMTDKLVGVSMDLILRKEAGLLHEEASKAVDTSILRLEPDQAKAYSGPLGLLVLEMWRSFTFDPKADKVPYPHPRAFGHKVARTINQHVYSRIKPSIIKELQSREGTHWQNLTDEVRSALTAPIMMLTSRIRTDGYWNVDKFSEEIDAFYPRYSQGYKKELTASSK